MLLIARGTPVRILGGKHDLEAATYVRPGGGGKHVVTIQVWVVERKEWLPLPVLVDAVMLLPR